MNKENVFRSSEFFMSVGDILHILVIDESGDPVTLTLVGEEIADDVPNAPVANAASDILSTSFTANCNLMENSIGYFLDVATDSAFTSFVAGYNNKDLGVDISDSVVGLTNATVYFYRFRAYNNAGTSISSNVIQTTTALENVADVDGNVYTYITIGTQQWMVENLKTTKYADLTPIPNIEDSVFTDWYLPSYDELQEIHDALVPAVIPALDNWWCSSEFDATRAYKLSFFSNTFAIENKSGADIDSFACRTFTAGVGDYSIGDTGEGGGWVFYISGTTYMEVSKTPNGIADHYYWSNVNLLLGTTGTAIGTGQANTTAIIGQVGHATSAAKLCDDLEEGGWINDTTGAYCYYNNDIANKADYGALYNWYAVDNVHGLAPTGWRVADGTDWADLITFLGEYEVAGGKLKEIGLSHWTTPNTDATDEYGFKAMGAGLRDDAGAFADIKNTSLHWVDQVDGTTMYQMAYNLATIVDVAMTSVHGVSVRCMRDVV